MNRGTFLIVMIAFAAVILTAMWIAWRGRTRRGATVVTAQTELSGATIAEFTHAGYVSTTPVGSPLERVAIPGLSFKGWADVTVREDGVTIAVTGEHPVSIPSSRIHGTGLASRRAGKAVERDGLSLLVWDAESQQLESSFRFAHPAEQRHFETAVSDIISSS